MFVGTDFRGLNGGGYADVRHFGGDTYNAVTGALSLIFSAPVDLYTLAYAATRNLPLTSTADLHGLTESVFATDGTVPIFRVGDVVVLQNNVSIAAATYANGNTVNCGRTDLASVRLIGNDGASILTGWTVDKTTGKQIYGMDLVLPGMLNAAIKACPVHGGKLKSIDAAKVEGMKGVKKVVQVGDSAIAVVADTFWQAKTGYKPC